MKETANDMPSFRPYHPGELLKEELSHRNIAQKDFAQRIGLPYSSLNEILNGKKAVSVEIALRMEAALGIHADLLVKMQSDYDLQTARTNAQLRDQLSEIRRISAL
jgi:addiction module HigA family antidote